MKSTFVRSVTPIVWISISGLLFSSCGPSSYLSSNATHMQVNLDVDPNSFDLVRLPEIKNSSKTIAGIQIGNRYGNRYAIIDNSVNFYGIGISGMNRSLPIISLGLLEYPVLKAAIWFKKGGFPSGSYVTLLFGSILAAGVNNQIWDPTPNAIGILNRRLVEENPDVDLIIDPKYKIDESHGWIFSESQVTLNALGAKLKASEKKRP